MLKRPDQTSLQHTKGNNTVNMRLQVSNKYSVTNVIDWVTCLFSAISHVISQLGSSKAQVQQSYDPRCLRLGAHIQVEMFSGIYRGMHTCCYSVLI